MKLSEVFLTEFDQEMTTTRKTLERIPDDFEFKPHEKSMALGYLARHIATLPDWATVSIKQDSFDVAPPDGSTYSVPEASNREEVLALFDKSAAEARAAIADTSNEDFAKKWTLLRAGETIFALPRFAMVRNIINHTIHHRAQLGVYLRLNNIPVPSSYGPSADEGSWG